MKDEDQLVPVFIPPLAELLARAEKVKEAPLTETEVVRLRDKAACIMMEHADAEAMAAKRGYLDVNPETCWSDWHRLRVQFTGNGCLPRIVLCLLGDADFAEKATPILQEARIEHEFRGRDERMLAAFLASGAPTESPLPDDEVARIKDHATVLYVLSENYAAQQAGQVSETLLKAGGCLLEAGGMAMKCESSGIAHSRAGWLDLASAAALSAGEDEVDFWSALFSAYVQLPIQDGDDYYTCGMHLLGKPDLIVGDLVLQTVLNASGPKVDEAIELFEGFANYLLGECPEGTFGSGHTFSLHDKAPRFRLLWEKCTGYDEDDFFFNPFGRWRFVAV